MFSITTGGPEVIVFALSFLFSSKGIEMGLYPIIPYIESISSPYCLCNNCMPLGDLITSIPKKYHNSPKGIEMVLHPIIPYLDNISKLYYLHNNYMPLGDLIT